MIKIRAEINEIETIQNSFQTIENINETKN